MHKVFFVFQKVIAILSALFITSGFSVIANAKSWNHDDCRWDRLRECNANIISPTNIENTNLDLFHSKNNFPMICENWFNTIQCVRNYTRRCMSVKKRKQFMELFEGTAKTIRDLCENESYQLEYITYNPCMVRAENYTKICLHAYTTAMTNIENEHGTIDKDSNMFVYQKRKRETRNKNIKNVCSIFNQYIECSTAMVRDICGEKVAAFNRKFLDNISSPLFKKHCDNDSSTGTTFKSLWTLSMTTLFVLLYYILGNDSY